jgi:hypothetical protein
MNERKTELSDDVVHQSTWSVGLRSANPTYVTFNRTQVTVCPGLRAWDGDRPNVALLRCMVNRLIVWVCGLRMNDRTRFFLLTIKNDNSHPICRVVVLSHEDLWE